MGKGAKMNQQRIEEYLKNAGEKEKEIRVYVTNPAVDYATRYQAWKMIDEFSVFLIGFLYCIALEEGADKALYYRDYYDQARSKKGVDNT